MVKFSKLLLLLICCFILRIANSQVVIQSLAPPEGVLHKDQLWNVNLVNPSLQQGPARLRLTLTDKQNGAVVLSAISGTFQLVKGTNNLNFLKLSPVQYTINQVNSGTSLLPVGTYISCYALVIGVNDYTETIAEECNEIIAQPVAPPMLTSINDSSILHEDNIQFTWQPPAPLSMFRMLFYDFVIMEMGSWQSAEDAIQTNLPFYSKANLTQNVHNLSFSSNSLERNKWYAWQVIARDGFNYAARSETWKFKIVPTQAVQDALNKTPFVKVNDAGPSIATAHDGLLKVHFYNNSADSLLKLLVVSKRDPEQSSSLLQAVVYGENYLLIDLYKSNRSFFREGESYQLSFIKKDQKIATLSFEIKSNQ